MNDKDGKDDLVGARWKLTVMEKGKAVEENVFRADKFKIYKGANEIGTFKQGREAITIEISKGKMELKLLKKDGTFYMGDWKTKDGETKKVKLGLLND